MSVSTDDSDFNCKLFARRKGDPVPMLTGCEFCFLDYSVGDQYVAGDIRFEEKGN